MCDCEGIDGELDDLHRELEVITELARKSIYENAYGTLSHDDWTERNARYQERHRQMVDRINVLEVRKREKQHKSMVLDYFIRNLADRDSIIDMFDEQIWIAVVKRVLISSTSKMTFHFKDGTEICR